MMASQGQTSGRKPLTEAQRVLLTTAAERDDRCLVLPAWLRGGAVAKVINSLAARGLIEPAEKGASGGWRASPAGLAAVGAAAKAHDADASAGAAATAPVDDGEGSGGDAARHDGAATKAASVQLPRAGTKADAVLTLLGRDGGASLDEIVAATGWLPHTARAALTGLRQRGIPIVRQRSADGISRYHAAENA